MTSMRRTVAVLCAFLLLTARPGAARAQAPAELREFLRDVVGFSDTDMAAVEKGQVKSVLVRR